MKMYQQIARAYGAYRICQKSGNGQWLDIWRERLETIMREHMPRGSGVDCGTAFDWLTSQPERLVLAVSFHHMDDHGGYCGWSHHNVIITPSLEFGFAVKVTGRDRRGIKDYLGSLYSEALNHDDGQAL